MAEDVKGIKLIRKSFEGMTSEDLRNTAELLIDRNDSLVVLFAGESDGKINYVCAAFLIMKKSEVKVYRERTLTFY